MRLQRLHRPQKSVLSYTHPDGRDCDLPNSYNSPSAIPSSAQDSDGCELPQDNATTPVPRASPAQKRTARQLSFCLDPMWNPAGSRASWELPRNQPPSAQCNSHQCPLQSLQGASGSGVANLHATNSLSLWHMADQGWTRQHSSKASREQKAEQAGSMGQEAETKADKEKRSEWHSRMVWD